MTNHNPFSPPLSAVADEPPVQAAKPKAILVLQIGSGLLGLLFAASLARSAWNINEWREHLSVHLGASVWIWHLIRFALVVASLALVLILQRRSQASRWIAVAWLVIMIIVVPISGPKLPNYSTEPIGKISAYVVAMVLLQAPFALLIFFSAFSKKARAYFAGSNAGPARS